MCSENNERKAVEDYQKYKVTHFIIEAVMRMKLKVGLHERRMRVEEILINATNINVQIIFIILFCTLYLHF